MNEIQIENVPLFSSLPRSEIQFLTETLRPVELEPGTVLLREGELGDKFYIILAGQVEIFKTLGKNDEQDLGRRGPGDYFGEMSLFIPDGLRTASIRALSAVKLMELSRSDFVNLLHRRPALAYEMVRELSLRLRKRDNEMIRDLQAINRKLAQAYRELQDAQEQLVEAEKLAHELNLAREIQKSILPGDLGTLGDFNFGARMQPARFVGGDLYDLIHIDQDNVGIAIGDVSGKGVPAAIFMALFCSLLRAEARHSASPVKVLRRVNRHLVDLNKSEMFVTALFGILNKTSHEFVYARAGHEVPIMFNRHGEARMLEWNPGQLLGFFKNPDIDENSVVVPSGCTLLLYTDGAFDATNDRGINFGLDRLVETVGANVQTSAQVLCDRVIDELQVYQGANPQFDDITLVTVQSPEKYPRT